MSAGGALAQALEGPTAAMGKVFIDPSEISVLRIQSVRQCEVVRKAAARAVERALRCSRGRGAPRRHAVRVDAEDDPGVADSVKPLRQGADAKWNANVCEQRGPSAWTAPRVYVLVKVMEAAGWKRTPVTGPGAHDPVVAARDDVGAARRH